MHVFDERFQAESGCSMQNLVGRKFKVGRDVQKFVRIWLITQDTDGLVHTTGSKNFRSTI
jgi:hypothetical protein